MSALDIRVLSGYVPFNACSASRLEFLIKHCSRLYLRQGQSLVEPGRVQDDVYFLIAGKLRQQSQGRILTASFRFPLHYALAQNDSLVALTDSSLFRIRRDMLDKLLCWNEIGRYIDADISLQQQYDDDASWMKSILQSNLFYKVPPINVARLFGHLTPMPVVRGQVVLKQGEVGDTCYFIRQGKAIVTRQAASDATHVVLAEIGEGSCFGEDALIHETVRNATVTMSPDQDGLLMCMEKRDFLQLLREPSVELISAPDLQFAVQSRVVLLDVRTPDEFAYTHLKGASSAPLGSLRILARSLDPHASYIVYCDTDRRSRAACYLLEQLGFRVRALQGGMYSLSYEDKYMFTRQADGYNVA